MARFMGGRLSAAFDRTFTTGRFFALIISLRNNWLRISSEAL